MVVAVAFSFLTASCYSNCPQSSTLSRGFHSPCFSMEEIRTPSISTSSSSPDCNSQPGDAPQKSDLYKLKIQEQKERKKQVNSKIASRKAISVILRREATKSKIEAKKGTNTKKLHPTTILEALHERITAYRWESALKVFELLKDQMWYKPNTGMYIKLIVMLGKCKQPEKAHLLFRAMIEEGLEPCQESYTALLSAYSRSGHLNKAYFLLEEMKNTADSKPDIHTYTILIKSCLHINAFNEAHHLLDEMTASGIKPNTVTYNTLIDSYGKAKQFEEMEATLIKMLSDPICAPDVWTMNSTVRAFGGSGDLDMMEACYERFLGAGIEPNIKTFNILLDSYGKSGSFEKMGLVMEYMQRYHFKWNRVTFNVVIDAFGRSGDLRRMEYVFRVMQGERVRPNCVTFCSLVRAYGAAGKASKVEMVVRMVRGADVGLDTVFFNCLVDAYEKLGCVEEMKGVLEMMDQFGCVPDKVTFRGMIKAYSAAGLVSHVIECRRLLRSVDVARQPKKRPDF